MKKFFILLVLICTNIYATDFIQFQQFDRQFNLGFGFNQIYLQNGNNEIAGVTQQNYAIEVERLFNNGIWFIVDGNIVTNSLTNQINGQGSQSSVFNQMPNIYALNAKLGHSFIILDHKLSVTPYGLIGRNANLSASTTFNNNYSNVTNDYYFTLGAGARLEFITNNYTELYLDQLVTYNWDQSAPLNGVMPQNNMQYVTTIGAKFNVYKQLMFGINAFYTLYQNMATLPTDSTGTSVYTPCNCDGSFGGLLSIGLRY